MKWIEQNAIKFLSISYSNITVFSLVASTIGTTNENTVILE